MGIKHLPFLILLAFLAQEVHSQTIFPNGSFDVPVTGAYIGTGSVEFAYTLNTDSLHKIESIEFIAFAKIDSTTDEPGTEGLLTTQTLTFTKTESTSFTGMQILGAAQNALNSVYTIKAVAYTDHDNDPNTDAIKMDSVLVDVVVDASNPAVTLLNIDDEAVAEPVFPNPATGINVLAYTIVDELLQNQPQDYLFELSYGGSAIFSASLEQLMNSGVITANESTYKINVDLRPFEDSNGAMVLHVTDGAGNSGSDSDNITIQPLHYPETIITNIAGNHLVKDTLQLFFTVSNQELADELILQLLNSEDETILERSLNLTQSLIHWDSFSQLATTDFDDGTYTLKTITKGFITDRAKNFASEVESEPLTIRIDNSNDGESEKAVILPLPKDLYSGSEDIRLSARSGGAVYGVRFEGKFTPKNSDHYPDVVVRLDSTTVQTNGIFESTFTENDLKALFNTTGLEGTLTFWAIGFDSAGVTYADAYLSGSAYNTGNMDESEIDSIIIEYDDNAPQGYMMVNGLSIQDPSSPVNTEAWDNQTYNDFNIWEGKITISAGLSEPINDYSGAYLTLLRLASTTPGTKNDFRASKPQIIATLNGEDESYTLDTETLEDGAVYEISLYLLDQSGNENMAGSVDFATIGPRAHIAGFNDEHGEFHVVATPHTQSVLIEVSTDSGSTFQALQIDVHLTSVQQNEYDAYKHAFFELESAKLPYGDLLFRVTASEKPNDEFSESHHANKPTTLWIRHQATTLIRPGAMQGIFTAITDNDIELTLYRSKGSLDDMRIEVTPVNADDNLTVFFIADENLNSTRNNLKYAYFPKNSEWDGDDFGINSPLESIDGNYLGFRNVGDRLRIDGNNDVDITGGGSLNAFATTVLPSGEVLMTRKTVVVNSIAAKNGGSATSQDGNFHLNIDANSLNTNISIMVEEDPGSLYLTHTSHKLFSQVSKGYYFNAFVNNSIRNGYRATLSIRYDDAIVMDVDGDGSIEEELKSLRVGYSVPNSDAISFNNILNTAVDTANNVVSFQLKQLPESARRYVVVQENNAANNPGSLKVLYVSVNDEQVYKNSLIPEIIVSDHLSNIVEHYIILNGQMMETSQTAIAEITNAIKFQASSLNNLKLSDGIHTLRFVVINDNGNRYDKTFSVILDSKPPMVTQLTKLVPEIKAGETNRLYLRITDKGTNNGNGAGVDIDSLYIDVYFVHNMDSLVYDPVDSSYIVQTKTVKTFFKQYGASEISEVSGSRSDSLEVYFEVVFNQEKNVTGYEYVVHNGKAPTISNGATYNPGIYTGFGLADRIGNQAKVVTFTVGVNENAVVTSLEEESAIPDKFFLSQNYPNPFNPTTTIQYGVPAISNVTIKLYNTLGQEVATLVKERHNPGTYQINFDASQLASGMYIYRIVAGKFTQTKKLMLIK